MNSPQQLDPKTVKKNRGTLLLLVFIFFGSLALAGFLRFAGWQPTGLVAKGNLLKPAIDARALAPASVDGKQYAWNPAERKWRLLVLAPETTCDAACERTAADVDKVWQIMGKDADRLDILWSGVMPSDTQMNHVIPVSAQAEIRKVLPQGNRVATSAGLPIYIVDPNGFVMMEYKPGADIGGVRSDLAKVLKLQ